MPYPPQGFGSGGGVSAHNLLSSVHLDTSAGTVVMGDMVAGNTIPKWARLPIGLSNQVLAVASGLPAWTTETLLCALHADTSAGSAVAGDLISANSVPKWARLPVGSSGQVLTVVNGVPTWANLPTIGKGIKYYLGSTQSIPSSASYTIVKFDTKDFDDFNEFSTSTYKFSPQTSGRYLIAYGITFQSVSSMGTFSVEFEGTSSGLLLFYTALPDITASSYVCISQCAAVDLLNTDTYFLQVSQTTGLSQTLPAFEGYNWLMIIRLF
jgi:hypothetical protein